MKHAKRLFPALLLACALLVGLCSCGKSANASRAPQADGFYGETTSGSYTETADESFGTTTKSESGSVLQPSERKLVRTFYVSFETKSYDEFLSSLQEQLRQYNGYSEKSEQSTGGTLRYASFTLRVPAENADAFLTSLRPLATVRREEEEQKDVTLQYVDNESRLRVLRTEQESLERLLAQADSMENILQIRDRLTEINEEIEAYTAALRAMDNQVDYATFTLSVQEVERITAVENEGTFAKIGRQFKENLSDIGVGLRAFFIWFVSAVPYFVLIGVLGAILFFVIFGSIRHGRRRRAKRRAAKAAQSTEQ